MMLMPNPDQTDCITASIYTEPVKKSVKQFGNYVIEQDSFRSRYKG